jgi:hypothetical protein
LLCWGKGKYAQSKKDLLEELNSMEERVEFMKKIIQLVKEKEEGGKV